MDKNKRTPRREMLRVISLSLVLCLFIWLSMDIIINFSVKAIPDRPKEDLSSSGLHDLLYYLENPVKALQDNVVINEEYIINAIQPIKDYIDGRYDCMDFRMVSLIRLQYLYGEEIRFITPEGSDMIKDAFLNAKYWLTEPGRDSLCTWSENHQILFAVAEYLAGQIWPEEIFTNDNTTGLERMIRARRRINYWMEHRFRYGYAEFNSTNYYQMNFGPMANFIQFASSDDQDMVEKMKMCLDLLIYDMATNMYDYTFVGPTGRAYTDNMVGETGDRMRKFTDYLWGLNDEYKETRHHMMLSFVSMMEAEDEEGVKLNLYEVPEVLLEIGRDRSERVIKSSIGLDLSEVEAKGYIGLEDEQLMMQLGMEAFTNPEVINNTMTMINKYDMLGNTFLNQFKYINLSLLRTLKLHNNVSKLLDPMPNGIAIQRANIYNYTTEHFKIATVQAYHPGSYGAQQTLSMVNLSNDAVVFTTHPARHESERNAKAIPGYWAGYGRAPHNAQNENVLLSIYQLPKKKNLTELYDVPQFTHTYFPEAFMDEVIVEGRYAFGRVGDTFISLTGASNLEYLPYSEASALAFRNNMTDYPNSKFDLVQHGLNQYWIYELSDTTKESFEDFRARIKSNSVNYNGVDSLIYSSNDITYDLTFKGNFRVNNAVQDFNYKRFDSKYIIAERESDEFFFNYNGYSLRINYNELVREISNP